MSANLLDLAASSRFTSKDLHHRAHSALEGSTLAVTEDFSSAFPASAIDGRENLPYLAIGRSGEA
jgi:hypothetical protein